MAGWHFITLPTDLAEKIKKNFQHITHGWGSIPVNVNTKQTSWKTSIFPDKKTNSYILPLKSEIRKKENLSTGDTVTIKLEITE